MRFFVALGAFFAMTGVMLGAFAAHGLKQQLSPELLAVFQTGVQYQLYHGLGLLIISLFWHKLVTGYLKWSAGLISTGIVFFSGSLYMLALTGIKWFGPITPLGGMCFIFGWLCLLVAALKENN